MVVISQMFPRPNVQDANLIGILTKQILAITVCVRVQQVQNQIAVRKPQLQTALRKPHESKEEQVPFISGDTLYLPSAKREAEIDSPYGELDGNENVK
ncbi:hypothetical protein CEXT_197511 [Caerostris extrusa]|uniref:Uncharacterized protein n=1 Tax=Caerostris extrusa TaxID=172846 RepID=A0AAV4T2Z7_CAEEX|nr:hypothetical protein CEXT_197511 [Caerostris extrusa]